MSQIDEDDRCHVCGQVDLGDTLTHVYDCRRCGEPTCGRDSCGDYDYSEDKGSVVVCRPCLDKRKTAPTSRSGVGDG